MRQIHPNIFFLSWAVLGVFFIGSCTVSPSPKANQRQLVSADAKVFDNRFKGISFTDLNLKDFWTDGTLHGKRETAPINNKTFASMLTEKPARPKSAPGIPSGPAP